MGVMGICSCSAAPQMQCTQVLENSIATVSDVPIGFMRLGKCV